MKKVMLILFCLTILLITVSCDKSDKTSLGSSYNDSSTDEKQNILEFSNNSKQQENDNSIDNGAVISSADYSNVNNLPQTYLQVIKNEKPFVFMNESILISDYKSPYLQKYLTQCDNAQYSVLDLDGDGQEEILISGWTSDILVLHEENGIVYGFDFTFRGMYYVKTDGSYCWNTNQGNTYGWSKLSFKNGICSVLELSRVELSEDGNCIFFVNGVKVDKEEYKLFSESISILDNITWYKLSIFPIDLKHIGKSQDIFPANNGAFLSHEESKKRVLAKSHCQKI